MTALITHILGSRLTLRGQTLNLKARTLSAVPPFSLPPLSPPLFVSAITHRTVTPYIVKEMSLKAKSNRGQALSNTVTDQRKMSDSITNEKLLWVCAYV